MAREREGEEDITAAEKVPLSAYGIDSSTSDEMLRPLLCLEDLESCVGAGQYTQSKIVLVRQAQHELPTQMNIQRASSVGAIITY